VAELGDGWQVEMSTPEEFGERWARIRAYARAAGRSPLPAVSMIHFYVNVQDRSPAAFDEARRFYEAYHLGTFPDQYLRWRLVTGTPAEVTERLAGFLDAGCTLPILRFASWDPMGQMRRAMATVLPALRDHAARLPAARSSSPSAESR
jgi:alkanesulfonate monooxygenase SsuD/methylene tetrahydromethanopterin reductase-like flavin-dependent oxidoreductase (luciferase family)